MDLFDQTNKVATTDNSYTAADIEVLEGLAPVRHRPGMYIGDTMAKGYHHLFAEILDNSMDEAVAGHASNITVNIGKDNVVTVADNGRGIPSDMHPKFKDKSTLEVLFTVLHSGGKFTNKAYETSGGLHGVGLSVVNALSDYLAVTVYRDGFCYEIEFSKGEVVKRFSKTELPNNSRKRGTEIAFRPDPEIFEDISFNPVRLYKMCYSKAYLYKGIKIKWKVDNSLITDKMDIEESTTLHFPKGLLNFIESYSPNDQRLIDIFAGESIFADKQGRVEWAMSWNTDSRHNLDVSYCNTIPTPDGGTHEQGFRYGVLRAIKTYGALMNNRKVEKVTADDVFDNTSFLLSVFIKNPQFQGQTKEKLGTREARKLVENAVRDSLEIWFSKNKDRAEFLINLVVEKTEARLQKREVLKVSRRSVTNRLRLPGKLADCSVSSAKGTEVFIVEGDSAGGSAKQARDRKIQAILPLKGKILNVFSATMAKKNANQEIQDLIEALGCGIGDFYNESNLRYEKVIIMTDADVDGAHIAALLMTFFYQEMPRLIEGKHLYLAVPPLYKITDGRKTMYARDDNHRNEIIDKHFTGGRKYDISRFKGLGEMSPAQLKETTMNPKSRILYQVRLDKMIDEMSNKPLVDTVVDILMGKNAGKRLEYIIDKVPDFDLDQLT